MIWSILPNGELETRNILYGHEDEITCLAVSEDLDIVVSGSKDKTAIIHTLLNGKYVRSISLPNNESIDEIKISKQGNIVIYSNVRNFRIYQSLHNPFTCTALMQNC
jgi:neurobeachin-like protein 1/2